MEAPPRLPLRKLCGRTNPAVEEEEEDGDDKAMQAYDDWSGRGLGDSLSLSLFVIHHSPLCHIKRGGRTLAQEIDFQIDPQIAHWTNLRPDRLDQARAIHTPFCPAHQRLGTFISLSSVCNTFAG